MENEQPSAKESRTDDKPEMVVESDFLNLHEPFHPPKEFVFPRKEIGKKNSKNESKEGETKKCETKNFSAHHKGLSKNYVDTILALFDHLPTSVSVEFYGIMADECADISNTEQSVFCARWVDDSFCVHEDFLGLHSLERTTSSYIVSIIKNILLALDLKFEKIRVQTYDGAKNIIGSRSGVKTQIINENSKVFFVHCYNHALNLAVSDTIKNIKLLEDNLCMCKELIDLIKGSPKRKAALKNAKMADLDTSPGSQKLCPTRWTVKHASLNSITSN